MNSFIPKVLNIDVHLVYMYIKSQSHYKYVQIAGKCIQIALQIYVLAVEYTGVDTKLKTRYKARLGGRTS